MDNPMDLTGRRILVTGASSGLGRTASVVLSGLGADLILVARDAQRLNDTRELTEKQNHEVSCFDLRQTDQITVWMKELAGRFGTLDGLVHCAGIQPIRSLQLTTPEVFDSAMQINTAAAFQLARGFRQRRVRGASGSIVFLSSVMGLVGQPGIATYCASKGALTSLVRALALELANEKIRVNCVAPGQVRTEMVERAKQVLTAEQFAKIEAMHPLGIGDPIDVAHSIAFLIADTGRWITGTTLTVDGGYTAH